MNTFSFQGHPLRISTTANGRKLWFAIKDLCNILGVDSTGPDTMVSEYTLRELISKSPSEQVNEFSHWIYCEIIPSLDPKPVPAEPYLSIYQVGELLNDVPLEQYLQDNYFIISDYQAYPSRIVDGQALDTSDGVGITYEGVVWLVNSLRKNGYDTPSAYDIWTTYYELHPNY